MKYSKARFRSYLVGISDFLIGDNPRSHYTKYALHRESHSIAGLTNAGLQSAAGKINGQGLRTLGKDGGQF